LVFALVHFLLLLHGAFLAENSAAAFAIAAAAALRAFILVRQSDATEAIKPVISRTIAFAFVSHLFFVLMSVNRLRMAVPLLLLSY
jgi:hypothetical protein